MKSNPILLLFDDTLKNGRWYKSYAFSKDFFEHNEKGDYFIKSEMQMINQKETVFSIPSFSFLFQKVVLEVPFEEEYSFYVFNFSKRGRKINELKALFSTPFSKKEITNYLKEKEALKIASITSKTLHLKEGENKDYD